MKVFVDSDVILDFLTGRDFYFEEIKTIFNQAIRKQIDLFTSPVIIANVHYFISKTETSKKANNKVGKLLTFIRVLELGEKEIKLSLNSGFKDFEDGIQNFCAIRSKMKIILTRNVKDFKLSHSLEFFDPFICLFVACYSSNFLFNYSLIPL